MCSCRSGRINVGLRTALRWWCTVLRWELAETRAWKQSVQPPVHLFVDARGSPARCAAVLFVDGKCLFTDGQPSLRFMGLLEERRDNQIMSLEIMAVAVGLSTFADELKGRKVVVYSDNTGAEVCAHCLPRMHCVLLVCILFARKLSEKGARLAGITAPWYMRYGRRPWQIECICG